MRTQDDQPSREVCRQAVLGHGARGLRTGAELLAQVENLLVELRHPRPLLLGQVDPALLKVELEQLGDPQVHVVALKLALLAPRFEPVLERLVQLEVRVQPGAKKSWYIQI